MGPAVGRGTHRTGGLWSRGSWVGAALGYSGSGEGKGFLARGARAEARQHGHAAASDSTGQTMAGALGTVMGPEFCAEEFEI